MAEEAKYIFDDDEDNVPGFVQKLGDIVRFIWNSKTKEFCGRDGASWAKVSLFYGVFYTALGAFFIGMLAVFVAIMPKDKPTYYGMSSVMNSRVAPLNPGLGFRPHIDPEDQIIRYDPLSYRNPKIGSVKYSANIKNFLESKYSEQDPKQTIDCSKNTSEYSSEFTQGKSCKFDHKELYKSTVCTERNNYNYGTPNPCVLIKLNKIVSWKPKTNESYFRIRCSGEGAFDVDNIKKIIYHSEGFLNQTSEGRIMNKYYPFWAKTQSSYRAPFIWVVFDVEPNTLINVECKAYADNIDNSDRLNRRGQTRFTLFVEKHE